MLGEDRSYLTEARFIAVFHRDSKVLDEISKALLDPVWGVWFGLKTCIPAMPLSPVVAPSLREALAAVLVKLGKDPGEVDRLTGVTEQEGEERWYQADQPIAFGQHHAAVPEPYLSRPVRRLAPGEIP